MMIYAGIGSRETPTRVCEVFTEIASWLAGNGYILRSGHAQGADQALPQLPLSGRIRPLPDLR